MKALLLLFSALKLGKVLTTGGTMLLSVFAYSFIFGWPYAAGFVLLIFVHEMGHFIAARRRGLKVGAPILVELFFYSPSPLLILMAILAAPLVMKAWRGPESAEEAAYYNVQAETRLNYAVQYLGLIGFLAIMCNELHKALSALR